MQLATATEVKDHFGEYMDLAQNEPVTVEQTGKPYIVLLSLAHYERLQAYEDAVWGQKAHEAAQCGYLTPEETTASIRRRLDAIDRGEE